MSIEIIIRVCFSFIVKCIYVLRICRIWYSVIIMLHSLAPIICDMIPGHAYKHDYKQRWRQTEPHLTKATEKLCIETNPRIKWNDSMGYMELMKLSATDEMLSLAHVMWVTTRIQSHYSYDMKLCIFLRLWWYEMLRNRNIYSFHDSDYF